MELTPELTLDGITFEGKAVTYARAADGSRTFYVELPRELKVGEVAEVTVAYHGQPVTQGRFGCFSFDKDKEGKPWITTACEGEGASGLVAEQGPVERRAAGWDGDRCCGAEWG